MRAIIAAGGTGGHIFPALALAKALQKESPDLEILFFGAKGGMEERLIPEHGFKLKTVRIGRLNRNVGRWERLTTLIRLPLSIVWSLVLLLRFRPRFVLGVGGHASAPILLTASFLPRIKTFIWEPNAVPGLSNRWLSRFVDESLVVFNEAAVHLKTKHVHQVGLPVRETIEKIVTSTAASPSAAEASGVSAARFDDTGTASESTKPFHVLVVGGSQGARAVNKAVQDLILKHGKDLKNFSFVHQVGALDYEVVRQRYLQSEDHSAAQETVAVNGVELQVLPFLKNMAERYAWADMVICRCGISTISELAACGKPAILIPLPSAADNHQQRNAEAVVSVGGGLMILEKDLTPEKLKDVLVTLSQDRLLGQEMGQKIRAMYRPGAAHEIAQYLLGRVSK